MLISEFIERTGITPTAEEYERIEQEYYNFNGNKDEYCKSFVKNIIAFCNERGKQIEQMRSKALELDKIYRMDGEKKDEEIARLKAELDKELEWKPCDCGTNMKQADYEELLDTNCGGRVLSEEEAKQEIYDEFGFAPEKVKIITKVSTYEANKYHHMRKSNTYERKPVYNASDWNYIRFDAGAWQYEMIDGNLKSYMN